jgi:transcriptional regulator with XRE-family HTH domain
MTTRRSATLVEGDLESRNLARTLGREVAATRRRRRWNQTQLGCQVGLSRARISEIERGEGRTAPLESWVRLGIVLHRPLGVALAREIADPSPADAGHLDAQELVLRTVRSTGRERSFELPSHPGASRYSTDVGVRDDAARVLALLEIWNRFDDVGRGARSTDQKLADTEGVAIAFGHGRPYRVASCWLLVDTAANRNLVARYREILKTRFPGSSSAWVAALVTGAPIPDRPGIAWVDLRTRRIVPLRWRTGS